MIGKGATPSFFAIANYNYTLTYHKGIFLVNPLQNDGNRFKALFLSRLILLPKSYLESLHRLLSIS